MASGKHRHVLNRGTMSVTGHRPRPKTKVANVTLAQFLKDVERCYNKWRRRRDDH